MATLIGGYQIASSDIFLKNCTYKIKQTGKYLLIFCASSSLPGDMIATYRIYRNKAPIVGAFSRCASAKTCNFPFIFPTNISIVTRLRKDDILSIKIDILSGILSDSIDIINTIFNIIEL